MKSIAILLAAGCFAMGVAPAWAQSATATPEETAGDWLFETTTGDFGTLTLVLNTDGTYTGDLVYNDKSATLSANETCDGKLVFPGSLKLTCRLKVPDPNWAPDNFLLYERSPVQMRGTVSSGPAVLPVNFVKVGAVIDPNDELFRANGE
jgi:hypothetical protein